MPAHLPSFETWLLAEQDSRFAEHLWLMVFRDADCDPPLERARRSTLYSRRDAAHGALMSAMRDMTALATSLRHRCVADR